ncbi:MAG: DUF1428 domain-containing protein [Pseudomonadota bacterium]
MTFVDGFVIAVPTANKEKYRVMAESVAPLFKKHGALTVVEAWGVDVPDGEVTSFPMAVKATDDETVVFSWIVWPDKSAREAGNPAVMKEMEGMDMAAAEMPFDPKRMIFGGFETIVSH